MKSEAQFFSEPLSFTTISHWYLLGGT